MLRALSAETVMVVLDSLGPFRDVQRTLTVCRRLRQIGQEHHLLHKRWVTTFSAGVPPSTTECWLHLCHWVGVLRFAGSWRERSYFEGNLLCEFLFELEASQPPEWSDLYLLDQTQVGPLPADAHPGTLHVRRAPPPPPDPAVVLKGYHGKGTFPPQQVWNTEIAFTVIGWSLGCQLCLEITWNGGSLGHSTIHFGAPLPADTANLGPSPVGTLHGTFVNHDTVIGNFTGDTTLEILVPGMDLSIGQGHRESQAS